MAVLRGATAPERVEITIVNVSSDPDPLDLTTVEAVAISALMPNGAGRADWTTEIAAQTEAELVLVHVFDAADVEQPGAYLLTITMNVPGGTRRAGPVTLNVI
jgi:hypothetical protein